MPKKLAALLVLLVPVLCGAEPIGVPAYHLGDPIYITFRYDGGIKGWDGRITPGQHAYSGDFGH